MTPHGAPLPDCLERASLPLESKQTGRNVIMSDEQNREKSKENEHFAAACIPAGAYRSSSIVSAPAPAAQLSK